MGTPILPNGIFDGASFDVAISLIAWLPSCS
jgi:hypothetical protein